MPFRISCFRYSVENGSQNCSKNKRWYRLFGARDRPKNASAPQSRYLKDVGSHFGDIFKVLASKIKQLGPHGRTNSVLFSTDVAKPADFSLTISCRSASTIPFQYHVHYFLHAFFKHGFSTNCWCTFRNCWMPRTTFSIGKQTVWNISAFFARV